MALDIEGKIHLKKSFSFSNAGKLVKDFSFVCYDVAGGEEYTRIWLQPEGELNAILTHLNEGYSNSGRGITNLSKIELIDSLTKDKGREEIEYPYADTFLKKS